MTKPRYTTQEIRNMTRSQRCNLRKRGADIPMLKPGPKKGYKQSNNHVEKRKRTGENHYNWKGDKIQVKSGRSRAIRKFKTPNSCQRCNKISRLDRHHIDGNTANNEIENISFLCRKCHMEVDGRLEKLKEIAKENQPNAVAARWR